MCMSLPLLDRLAILTVSGAQADGLFSHLDSGKFNFTVINSTGGVLQEPEVCLLVGFQKDRLQDLMDLVRRDCRKYRQFVNTQGYSHGEMMSPSVVEAELGGARFYLMNVERFEQF
jgi:uncharacterized protein YaaQ